ncbi:MAG: phosphate ABC transporter substrate-binding protein PstS [Actinomycetota bacterium]
MRRSKSLYLIAGVVLVALVGVACSSNKTPTASTFKGVALSGAGSTFAAPLYDSWSKQFNSSVESGAQVSYAAVGSGAGITQITAKTVDFGASDAPLKDKDIAAAPGLLQFPTALGAVVLAYNVPGVPTELKLTPAAIAGIFLGHIKMWDDAAIKGPNSGVNLPHQPISVVHRTDASGTTYAMTNYLSVISAEWKNNPNLGTSKSVTWPSAFLGGNGNAGVAAKISQTKYSIGYVELAYALTNSITYADVQGPGGDYIKPSIESVTAAGAGLQFPITPTTSIVNSSAAGAYPISTPTYMLIYKDQTDKNKAQTLVDWIEWSLHKGGTLTSQLNYAPVPSAIVSQIDSLLTQVNVGGVAITPSSGVK